MRLSGIDDIGWDIQRLPGVPAQNAVNANTANAYGEVSTAANISALGQNLQVFMRALYEALSSAAPTTASNSNAGDTQAPEGSYTSPTYSKLQASPLPALGYHQGNTVLHSRIRALVSALKDAGQSGAKSCYADSSENSLVGLQTAFDHVLKDLGATALSTQAATSFSTNPFNVVSDTGSNLTLQGWLQGRRQGLQQPGAALSSLGNIIDVVV